MFELVVNTVFETVVVGPNNSTPPDPVMYLGLLPSPTNPIFTQVSQNSKYWKVSFTPTSTGLYTLFAWNTIQFREQCVAKSSYVMIKNLEDEALGSWTWDKPTGSLIVLRQDGSTLATFTATDTLIAASRERIS